MLRNVLSRESRTREHGLSITSQPSGLRQADISSLEIMNLWNSVQESILDDQTICIYKTEISVP